jgi:hypothetical protein
VPNTADGTRQSEIATADGNWRAYRRARDLGHREYVDRAKKYDAFYLGEQWALHDVQALDAEGRPHLTINQILKIVNAYLSEQKKQRADVVFKASRDGKHDTAVVLTKLIQQLMDENKFDYIERELFSDGIVDDRGYIDVRVDFQKNILGEVHITIEDPFEIMPDPDAKSYDPKDWNSVIKTKWMTLDEIEAVYGKKNREKIEAYSDTYVPDEFGSDQIRYDGARTFGDEGVYPLPLDDSDPYLRDIRAVRVIERQYRRLTKVLYFVDPITGDMSQVAPGIDEARAQKIADQTGAGLMTKTAPRIRWTVSAANHVFHDEWSIYRTFSVIPYFPFFRKGKASGVVRQLISPQEQFNKLESQQLHVVNTASNSGWQFETGSLVNMTKEDLENRGAETGLVLEYATGRAPPEKIKPNDIPTGLANVSDRARASIAEIAGIDPLRSDTQEIKIGDIKVDINPTIGQAQLTVPFDNLQRSRILMAEKVLELVQDFYVESRVLRATNWEDLNAEQEELPVNMIDAAGKIVNDLSIGEYDVVVGSIPSRDTYQEAQFAELMQMKAAGVMIPDDEVIRHSSLANKFDIADRVAQLTGTAEPTPEEIQVAQMMQQLEIAQLKANVAETEAKGAQLQASAQQEITKAQSLEGDAQMKALELAARFKGEFAALQAKLEMFYADLNNKLQLAAVHSESNERKTQFQEMSRTANEEFKAAAARATKASSAAQSK